jgi:hypothetical protein
MSARVFWQPTGTNWKPTQGQSRLAEILCLSGSPRVFDREVIAFIRGIAAAGIPGAAELADAIEDHGSIEVKVEY